VENTRWRGEAKGFAFTKCAPIGYHIRIEFISADPGERKATHTDFRKPQRVIPKGSLNIPQRYFYVIFCSYYPNTIFLLFRERLINGFGCAEMSA
jgi:hypothetical protein